MRIGIDIDDTVTNTHEVLLKCAYKYDKLITGKGIKDESEYEFYDAFYWTKEQTRDFFSKYFKDIVQVVKCLKDSKEVINKLYDEGYEIYFVTHRTNRFISDPYLESKKWLDKNHFKYNKILVNCLDKGITCKEYNIDLLIDDAVFNCVSCTNNNIDCILFSTSCNQKEERFRRANNWKEIYNIIKEEYDGRKGCNE